MALATKKINTVLVYKSNEGFYADGVKCCNYRSNGTFSVEANNANWCCLEPNHEGKHEAYTGGLIGTKKPVHTWDTFSESTPVGDKCILCAQTLCFVCGVCHTKTCAAVGKAATTKSDLLSLRHLIARTQKVRGYVALALAELRVPTPYRVLCDIADVDTVIPVMLAAMSGDVRSMFVRPCPVRPRHGFVESRVVSDDHINKVRAIYHEALVVDAESELLICPKIAATHNLIITPTRLAIGPGNDGATAGKSSISLPLMGVPFQEVTKDLLERASVDPLVDDPYIEVVILKGAAGMYNINSNSQQVLFTQLRAGVKIPRTVGLDYIPQETLVQDVVIPSDDLVEWERQVATLVPGTVVYKEGGTLIAHYGVHCMLHNIPVMTTRKPILGETLVRTEVVNKPDPRSVIEGLAVGLQIKLFQGQGEYIEGSISCNQAALIVMYALHNVGALGDRDGFWIGVAVSLMMRLGSAASHGEGRHADALRRALPREQIYKLALNDFFVARQTLGIVQERFINYNGWSTGYGGKKWAECTESLFTMDISARALMNYPTEQAVTALISTLNHAVTRAHNGGWWLNKFVKASAFDLAAQQSLYTLAAAAPGMLNIVNLGRTGIDELIGKWRTLPDIVVPGSVIHNSSGGDTVLDNLNAKLTAAEVIKQQAVQVAMIEQLANGLTTDVPAGAAAEYQDPIKTQYKTTNNVGGIIPIPDNAKIVAAHGSINPGGKKIHVQVRLEGINGYYSFGIVAADATKDYSKWHTEPSYSGSGTKYIPFVINGVVLFNLDAVLTIIASDLKSKVHA